MDHDVRITAGKMPRWPWVVLAFTAVGVIAYFGSDDGTESSAGPSDACAEAMSAAAEIPIDATAEYQTALGESLDACETSEDWLDALQTYPGVLGLTEDATITEADLDLVCAGNESRNACMNR